MTDILLISPNFIRSHTNISSNTQDKILQSAIREAQDFELQEILGTKLLTKVKKLVEEDKIDLSEYTVYKEMLDISKYFLAYSVVARVVVISSFKIDNIGTAVASDDHVNPVDFNNIFKLEQYYKNKADVYAKRIQAFLEHNRKHIKELYDNCCHETQSNTYSAASCGVWLGGTRGKHKYI